MDLLGRSKLPQVELNEDELNALSGLGKVDSKTGLSYNPYKDINPEFLKLTEDDDDDWLYMSEEQKPRERHGHIFNMVGSAGLIGGAVGMIGGLSVLKRQNFLTIAALRHPIKRSETITKLVSNVRDRSGQYGSFAFCISLAWAFLDKTLQNNVGLNITQQSGAAVGGFMFGFLGPFWHKDWQRTMPALLKKEDLWLKQYGRAPRPWQMNLYMESFVLNRCRGKSKVPGWINVTTGMTRCFALSATAYGVTAAMDWASRQKGLFRDIKRWKW